MSTNKGPDGLCIDCGCVHDYWHAENPDEWSYKDGCLCHLCQEYERKTQPQEYTDGPTGIRLTVERDGTYKDNPRITVYAPENCTLAMEEAHEAIHRLLAKAGIRPAGEQGGEQ